MGMLILVDEYDKMIGTEENAKAHREGMLHRAFSIFVFNSNGELLIQKRAQGKNHIGGLWTNTCYSHPVPDEKMTNTIHKTLEDEMGFDCGLRKARRFIYRAELANGLTEHEFEYIFFGIYDGEVKPNMDEVEDFKWIDINTLEKDLKKHPEKYSPWLRDSFYRILSLRTHNSNHM
jgi:isopentenyl-diphosphate delta-isomerase